HRAHQEGERARAADTVLAQAGLLLELPHRERGGGAEGAVDDDLLARKAEPLLEEADLGSAIPPRVASLDRELDHRESPQSRRLRKRSDARVSAARPKDIRIRSSGHRTPSPEPFRKTP